MATEHAEARLFFRLRWTILRSALAHLLATSRLRLLLAAVVSAVFWTGLFLLMYEGFDFLHREAGAFSRETVEKIFNLFYASLMVMLVFSAGIILYGALYQSREVAFLLTSPVRAERIFTYKFQEALLFSSWGFLLLGSPMLIAYGIVVGAPWYYFVLTIPFMVAFVFVPSELGALACLLIVYHLTRLRKPLTIALALATVAVAGWLGWTVVLGGQHDMLTHEWFEETMVRLSATENRLFPSWWLSSGLLEAARAGGGRLDYQPWAQAILFLALLVANGLFLHQLAQAAAGRFYASGYSRLHTERGRRRESSLRWLDRLLPRLMILAPMSIRLLLVKDFRIFRRDPVQWAQFLIFFGLVALYFLNMQGVRYSAPFAGWVNIVSFLNLTVVGLILSTFTTRFIFPMISLEGRRFWILGLLPVPRDTILWGKYVFAALGTGLPSSLLILTSDLLLGIAWEITLTHQLTCGVLCSGLAAIAVGLGAQMPDLRETNPSKIAAGFGGTVNLVVSACYILLVVTLTAIPSHLHVLVASGRLTDTISLATVRLAMLAGIAASLLLGTAATVIPLRMGIRAFRRLEF